MSDIDNLILPFFRSMGLDKYLLDPEVSELMITNGRVFVEYAGKITEVEGVEINERRLRAGVEIIGRSIGDEIDEYHKPWLDSRLPDGSRVAVTYPPISPEGVVLTVRKFLRHFTTGQLLERGALTQEALTLVLEAVHDRKNILVSGGTSTGKITMTNAFVRHIPANERIVLIEKPVEMKLDQRNSPRFEVYPKVGDRPEVTVSQLLSLTLRHRPDRIIVGEVKDSEAAYGLLQVQRQTNAEYKFAVEALRNHPAEGFAKLEAMGAIREVDWRLRAQETSEAYREAAAMPNRKGQARSVLVVTATHDEIKSVTHAIRQDRQRAGELAPGETFVQHTALNWTEAQKKQLKNYQPGQVLEFHKAVKGVSKNEALEVVSADESSITARKATGQDVTITARQTSNFAVFEKQEIEVAPGDKLLLKANWRDKNFGASNGELVSVAAIEGGAIKLQDGRELPAAYRQITHGYAVTAHRSQGKTVDFQIIAAEKMSQDLFYVSVQPRA